jgi:hypothetical protein
MNIGSSPDDAGYLLMGAIAALVVVPLLLAIVGLSARLIAWIFRIKSGWFMAAWWLIWIAGLLVGPSLYLDFGAETVTGTLTTKTESVDLRRQGDWNRHFNATFAYPYAGETGQVSLAMSEAHFDALREGGRAELNIAPIYNTIALVRLDAINTAELMATPLRWFAIIVLIVFAIWRAEKIKSRKVWIAIAIIALLLAIIIPTYLTYSAWQRADNLASRPLRAEATVTAVERITNIDYFPCERDCSDTMDTAFDVPQQYDIVQMTFLPADHNEEVLAADSADVGSYVTFVGDTVTIAYAADDPRNAQILGATHSHHWRNAIFFVLTSVASTLLLFGANFALHWGIDFFRQKFLTRLSVDDLRRVIARGRAEDSGAKKQ